MSEQYETLLYVADPMCSWCWGFSPVIDQIKHQYGQTLSIELVLGGLRPGTTQPMDAVLREEILHHWHEVHNRTGQPFQFDGAMREGFVYDTEPPSRAVVTLGELQPGLMLAFFQLIQASFYAEQKDVTKEEVLLDLVSRYDVAPEEFQKIFHSEEMKKKTLEHFQRARHYGVSGFPTLILQNAERHRILTRGYQPFENLPLASRG